MIKFLKKLVPLFFAVIVYSSATYVFAASTSVPLQIPLSGKTAITVCTGDYCGGIADYITIIYKWAVGFAAVLAVVALTYGGVLWMTAGGGKRTDEAKKVITNAIAGLILALCSYLLLATISPQYIAFQPIHIPGIAPIKLELEEYKTPISVARSDMASNNTTYDALFKKYADQAGIDCTFIKAMGYQESGLTDEAPNCANAVGVLQVVAAPTEMKDCHGNTTSVGITGRHTATQLLDHETNIRDGVAILKEGLSNPCPSSCRNGETPFPGCSAPTDWKNVMNADGTSFTEGVQYALAAYNAGSCRANVVNASCPGKPQWQCPGAISNDETLKHIPRVFAHYKKLKDNGWGC